MQNHNQNSNQWDFINQNKKNCRSQENPNKKSAKLINKIDQNLIIQIREKINKDPIISKEITNQVD